MSSGKIFLCLASIANGLTMEQEKKRIKTESGFVKKEEDPPLDQRPVKQEAGAVLDTPPIKQEQSQIKQEYIKKEEKPTAEAAHRDYSKDIDELSYYATADFLNEQDAKIGKKLAADLPNLAGITAELAGHPSANDDLKGMMVGVMTLATKVVVAAHSGKAMVQEIPKDEFDGRLKEFKSNGELTGFKAQVDAEINERQAVLNEFEKHISSKGLDIEAEITRLQELKVISDNTLTNLNSLRNNKADVRKYLTASVSERQVMFNTCGEFIDTLVCDYLYVERQMRARRLLLQYIEQHHEASL